MNYRVENQTLIIIFEGRLDTESVSAVDKEITEICQSNPHESLCFDATNLSYIASSGLRIMLKYAKTEKNFCIDNVMENVYNVFAMTGFTKIIDIRKALRRINLDECERIGFGGNGAVYRVSEDEIVKVNYDPDTYSNLENELNRAKEAFLLGIPTAISFDMVDCGDGKRGVIYETIKNSTLGETINNEPERMEELTEKYVEQLKALHAIRTDNPIFGNAKESYRKQIELTSQYLTEEETALMYQVLDALPDGDRLVHCDAHPKNLMIQNGEMMWIDMELMSVGHPIYDLISIAVITKGLTNEELAMNVAGMSVASLEKLNACFIRKYFGTEDPAMIERLDALMNMLRLIRMIFVIGKNTPNSEKHRPAVLQFSRAYFFPKVQEIIGGIKYLVSIIE